MKTAAIYYQKEGYDTQGKKIMGRQAAGEGFLRAIARYSTAESLYCYTQQQAVFEEFCQQVRPWIKSDRKINWVPSNNPLALQEAGLLYRPDPIITQLAWQRRYSDQRAYSLCGITHTLASKETMKILGDYLIAPIQPWDALICTSNAVKTMVERLLENWAEYLAQRLNARPQLQIQLPVIPLGVDCESFAPHDQTQEIRDRLRTSLNISDNDIVVLYVGRLIFHAKAHPVPMYLALEKAARATNTKIHLIQAGWFEDEKQESSFKKTASLFSPSVNHIFVDGRRPEIRKGIWSAADIFISLADNVQETFGLTPIEAMAAGLPIVVSDWNGYKETVRHEIDGFRIPTIMPPAGCGLDFATSYSDDSLNYSTFVGHISLITAIDVDACAQALTTLITQPQLRQRMGENGRQRAREMYDWSRIIAAYENFWQELAEKRLQARSIAGGVPHPLCDDPCRVWERYPTEILPSQQRLTLGSMATSDRLEIIRSLWITNFGANKRSPAIIIDRVLAAIAQAGSLTVAEILSSYSDRPAEQVYLCRTLVYLLKFDVLRRLGEEIV
jgi:alpha-maltose-1-phosphate synthase